LPITRALAGKWLAHFRASLEIAVPDVAARCVIYEKVRQLATALVNEGEPRSALRTPSHGACLRYPPAVDALDLARRGDAAALRKLLTRAPDVLASAPHAAKLLRLAVLAGRGHVVDLLLDNGVDVNKPSPIETLTAVDALEITPVHHAVAGGHVEALCGLLTRAAQANEPLRGGKRALALAVERENVAIVAKLLDLGADATTTGPGRWVLHPELAPMLSHAGARIDRSGGWIQVSCTGNQGRKDDPEYVAALLRHGARVDDKRTTVQKTDGGRATALHYAAKAGFVKTIAVLLDHGADPAARDDNGLTPLDWLERASKSVDRDAVRCLLHRRRV
jgi:ankyrin repeat protein